MSNPFGEYEKTGQVHFSTGGLNLACGCPMLPTLDSRYAYQANEIYQHGHGLAIPSVTDDNTGYSLA